MKLPVQLEVLDTNDRPATVWERDASPELRGGSEEETSDGGLHESGSEVVRPHSNGGSQEGTQTPEDPQDQMPTGRVSQEDLTIEHEKPRESSINNPSRHGNVQSQMNRILPEVLAHIFTLIASECTQAMTPIGTWRNPYNWIMVTHVCQSWRHIALSYPRVWTHVHTAYQTLAAVSLERAGPAVPLDIFVTSQTPKSWLEKVQAHVHRVQTLRADAGAETYTAMQGIFGRVYAPALAELDLRTEATSASGSKFQLPQLFRVEALRSLYTCGFWVSSSALGAFSTLREIMIEEPGLWNVSTSRFLDILEQNSRLERVAVWWDSTLQVTQDIFALPSPARIVRLPCLRALELQLSNLRAVLVHLALPRDARVCVSLSVDQWSAQLEAGLPRSFRNWPFLEQVEVVRLRRMHFSNLTIDAATADGVGCVEICVDTPIDWGHRTHSAFTSSFIRSLHPLCLSRIRELWVDEAAVRSGSKLRDTGRFLASLPALERLVLLECGFESVLGALRPVGGVVPYLALERLTVHNPGVLIYPYLVEVLGARKAAGVVLRELRLVFESVEDQTVFQASEKRGMLVDSVERFWDDSGVTHWPYDIPVLY